MICRGILLLFLMQAASSGPPPGMPAGSGIYYRQDEARWIQLKPSALDDMKTRGLGLFIETGGYTNLGMKGVLNGARASIRIPMPRPTLYARGVGSSKDVILIQLKRRKDSRTFDTSSTDASIENKGGFRKKDIRQTAVVVYSDDSFAVAPEQDLKSGEYLLVFGNANSSYDFGVDLDQR